MATLDLNATISGAIKTFVTQLVDERIGEGTATQDIDVAGEVAAYFEQHPVTGVTQEALDEYFAAHPVSATLTSEQLNTAIAAVSAPDAQIIKKYGLDPTGKTDSSAGFQAMADEATGAMILPTYGRYQINKPVMIRNASYTGGSTHAKRKRIIGSSYNAFGGQFERFALEPGADLEGAMFSGAYRVEGVSFHGNKKEGVYALELDAYYDVIDKCTFNNFDIAIRCYQPVGNRVTDCDFTGCNVCAYHWEPGAAATVNTFADNRVMNCRDGFIFEGELHGTRFVGNTFERVTGTPIQAKSTNDCSSDSNWFEHTDRTDGDGNIIKQNPIITTASQQLNNWVTKNNHCQSGFNNIFNDDTHSGRVGGVLLEKGNLLVRDQTGSAVRLKQSGLYQEIDSWAGLRELVFRAGRAKAAQKSADIRLETHHKGSVVFRSLDDNEAVAAFSGSLKFELAEGRYLEQVPGTYFGQKGITEMSGGITVNTETPAMIKWDSAEPGRCRNLGLFESVEFADGVLTLQLQPNPTLEGGLLRNPIMIPVAYGATIENIELIQAYQRPTWEHVKGWKITFKDGVMPRQVHMTLSAQND